MTILLESAIRATLIAAIIGLVLFAMKIKTASVLHAVWAGVTLLMMLLPAWVAWGPKAPLVVLPPERSAAVEPLPPPSPAGLAERLPTDSPSPTPSPAREGEGYNPLTAIYLLGAGVLLLRLAIGTIRASRLQACVAPITVGILRPRVLLLESAKHWPQAQLDAVIAHEREHARRRDPLFQWLALLNRAIFWFHPLAWWLERKLAGLAEEACDAAVLSQGHDPREYSEYLLDLARSVNRTRTRIEAVGMAMPGVYLPQRIRRMLSGVPTPRISRRRMACAAAICSILAVIFTAGTLVRAQSQRGARPTFEVASVKASNPGGTGTALETLPGGRLRFVNSRLRLVIMKAYGLKDDSHLVGGPDWMRSARFDIEARAEGNTTERQMMIMLQALLEDRFKLKVHWETRELPVYVLTVSKNGPKLQDFKEGSCVERDPNKPQTAFPAGQPTQPFCGHTNLLRGRWDASKVTMSEVADALSIIADRKVIDTTGLTGLFDIHVELPPDPLSTNDPTSPSLFTFLQEQLGLKLESSKAPLEVLITDQLEQPSEN